MYWIRNVWGGHMDIQLLAILIKDPQGSFLHLMPETRSIRSPPTASDDYNTSLAVEGHLNLTDEIR